MVDFAQALGMSVPVVAAPMAGGPSTPELVMAAAEAGGLGFLAAGYKTPAQLAEQISTVRAATDRFGVNLFVPNSIAPAPGEFEAYVESLAPIASELGVELTTEPRDDDDAWAAKLELLVTDPVPVVSFTFGLAPADVVHRLKAAGTLTVQTVTNGEEALQARERGVDALVVQGVDAGGHSGTVNPQEPIAEVALPELAQSITTQVQLPIFAAGGISTPADVRAVLGAGAVAAVVGTVLLRCPEAGTSAPHRAALADPERTETVMTRAFSGRPARALRNGFTDEFTDSAPLAFPAVHHLTAPLRKAATATNQTEYINLWAGTGFRHAVAEPAAAVIQRLGGS
ncbi:NAD(P)H-dependent flavin oxidoreductase [Kocuria sp.]|uniref:NAD(P)H-dependent flavin oxidoreductase n=1 Tax=Kocuria sp. TaxID=1871328 RepID=UPI0026DFF4E3|nr:nitronate monooxygenase [Kocuria sp.]MDO5618864.1 nitronate monooxygenase [Kocuria sp.]